MKQLLFTICLYASGAGIFCLLIVNAIGLAIATFKNNKKANHDITRSHLENEILLEKAISFAGKRKPNSSKNSQSNQFMTDSDYQDFLEFKKFKESQNRNK